MYRVEFPYPVAIEYYKRVAYFCMEYAIHQPLKIYAGGLGYLAGSHLRSAFELKQNLVAVGILWKYGYYDQTRKGDQTMDVLFQEKVYGFLKPTGIKYTITVSGKPVWVTAYYLPPSVFNTAPLFLLSTDLPENDYLAKTICHKLYDVNPQTNIAASILLGIGGGQLFEHLDWQPDVYHLNESHGLPLAFYLYNKFKSAGAVKQRLVFTNHTAEAGGNPVYDSWLLENMGVFNGVPLTEVMALTNTIGDKLNFTQSALRLSGRANAVSKKHLEILRSLWSTTPGICSLLSITNAQNAKYWANLKMYQSVNDNDSSLPDIKRKQKARLFELVADQNGEIFDDKVFTLVFARRFAGYKRADLLLYNMERFHAIVSNKHFPIQIIWAGKPYPADYASIGLFDRIVNVCKSYPNCAILAGYELRQSRLLKGGADVWLNVPRYGHEASGTSGMTAAMNGALNFSIADGWVPEFAKDKINCFVIPHAEPHLSDHEQDQIDAQHVYDILEKEILPLYYDYSERWHAMMQHSMNDILPFFDSNRMADQYYRELYSLDNVD